MSSHREAPEISKDPVADSTDLYAFVSPDKTGTVTLIANYIPLEAPDGGPELLRVRRRRALRDQHRQHRRRVADITYQFRFTTVNNIPASFLYNDGPITSLTPPSPTSNWNRQQTYTLTRVDHNPAIAGGTRRCVLGSGLLCPPCNIGPLSTPNYAALAGRCGPLGRGRAVLGQGLRRPAGRGLLRRPRRGVRPRRSARLRRRPRRRRRGRAS